MKIGAKTGLIPEKIEMIQKLPEIVDFIEIYFGRNRIPLEDVRRLDTRWIVHGPHISQGVNFSNLTEDGARIFKESIELARDVGAKYVITHSGFAKKNEDKEKSVETMIEKTLEMKDFARENSVELLIENLMPEDFSPMAKGWDTVPHYYSVCTPEETKSMMKKTGLDFVFDFSHAFMASKYHKLDYKKFMEDFVSLGPIMFHICDSKVSEKVELHLPLGQGDYDIDFFASLIGGKDVTLEISSSIGGLPTLEDFTSSISHLRSLGYQV